MRAFRAVSLHRNAVFLAPLGHRQGGFGLQGGLLFFLHVDGTGAASSRISRITVVTVRPESLDLASVLGILELVRFALAAFVANLFVRQTAPFGFGFVRFLLFGFGISHCGCCCGGDDDDESQQEEQQAECPWSLLLFPKRKKECGVACCGLHWVAGYGNDRVLSLSVGTFFSVRFETQSSRRSRSFRRKQRSRYTATKVSGPSSSWRPMLAAPSSYPSPFVYYSTVAS